MRHLYLTEQEKGIFYVTGDIYPIQIICTSRLSSETNLWLRGLTNDLQHGELVDRLLKEYRSHQKNILYKSAMDMIIRANREVFKEEKSKMCEALRELFKDELEDGVAAGVAAGIEERLSEVRQEVQQEIRQEGINALIADNLEEGFSTERILGKLVKRFGLTPEEAQNCLDQFTS